MLHDIRLALRSFAHQFQFAALGLLIVALGAGANAAVFAVVYAVLLRPLPYPDPDRLVAVAPTTFFSGADADFLRDRGRGSFADVASSSPGWRMSLLGVGEPVQIVAARPSHNLLGMLGVRPVLGRLLLPEDGQAGRPRVAVLSHALWQSRFGGDPQVVGRTVMLDGVPREIVGVAGTNAGVIDAEAEAWVPFDAGSSFARGRSSVLYGRLRAGADAGSASRALQALLPDMQRELGLRVDTPHLLRAVPLHETIAGDVRTPLLFVAAAVGLLVLLTAANLGTLLLGRQVGRRRDLAVRAALGASRLRLARETIVENVLLAIGGAVAGLVIARLLLAALVAILPREMPRLADVAIDPVVILAVLLLTIASVLLVSVLPMLLTSPAGSHGLLRQGGQSQGRGSRRALDVLVVAQVALALVLGVAAALMVRSLWSLQHVNPGFAAESVLTLRLQPAGARYTGPGRMLAYFREVTERIAALPGVEAVGMINHLPLSGYNWVTAFAADERPAAADASGPRIGWRMVDGDYFSAMRIPLLAGRLLQPTDGANTPQVIVINETAARQYFGSSAGALGRTAWLSGATGEQQMQVVGVVGDVRHTSIAMAPQPEIYRPVAQAFTMAMTLVVRTGGSPAGAAAAVRSAVWSVDPNVAIAGMAPLTTAVRENLGRPRMMATLLLVFAGVGLAIVVCGVYGVVAYSVRRREREIGIRVALGAERSAIRSLVLRQGVRYGVAGLAFGVPAALAIGRLMQGLLYGIEPHDPFTLAALCATIALTTIAASLIPARRASRLSPAAVMKGD
jgi:putative ABC transport system permease protein